jgi:C4-dicarboxylate-specific signal transduction histidine kinase
LSVPARRRRRPTLQRALLLSGLIIVSAAALAMVGSVKLAMSQREAVERDSDAFMDEQRIADQIVALTYEQQLDAYRFLQRPDSAYLRTFRARGEQAYQQLQGYLFHELSAEARLQVESIKEAHQEFEVAAERAFDLARRGESSAALTRLAGMDRNASALDAAVRRFLRVRALQRDAFRREHEVLGQRLQIALFIVAGGMVLLVVVLSAELRHRVLLPLGQLTTAARRLGDGEQGVRVADQRYEEFNVVATGFNQMADRIEASRQRDVAQNRELREALDHLRTTQEELVRHEKLSAMGQMLAGLAHELNNPLGGILGMTEHLRTELAMSEHDDVRQLGKELAEPLEREALRANALVRSLLNFSRKPSNTMEPVELADAVRTAVGLRSHAFAQAGKALHVSVPPGLRIIADAQKLQHAMVNVVNNALDALVTSNGTALHVVATPEDDAHVCLAFEDDGPGFADCEAAFTPFYTTKRPGEGTGLGLMLVQRFMTEFGGSATAANREEGGARLTLRFQRAEDAPAIVPRNEPSLAAPESGNHMPEHNGAPRDTSPAGRRHRVLVVDDEPSIREVQRRLLQRANIDVVLASSGADARDLLLNETVDLVVSDVRMPGELDGYGLLAWLERERPQLARSAILATGDIAGPSPNKVPLPPERILRKPFQGHEFLACVQAALQRLPG